MGIDFSKFSADFKAKYEEAIKEGKGSDGGKKITKKEFESFSPADQKRLSALISGDPSTLGDIELDKDIDIKLYQTKNEDGLTGTITTYSGKKANEGLLDLTPDTVARYPKAKMGYLDRKGVVTLYDKSGNAITDENGKKVQFNFGEAESKSSLAAWYMENNGGKFNLETLTAYQNLDAKLDAMEDVDEDYTTLMKEIDLAELKNASEDQKASFFERLDAKTAYKKAQAQEMMRQAAAMYQDAVKNGGGQEVIGAVVSGLGPVFQLIDNAIGLRKFKDFVYDLNIANFTGLSYAAEALENVADDRNIDNTTYAEMTAALWSGVISGLEKFGGVNAIADTMTEAADDGDDSHVSAGEKTVEIIKGLGRGVDSFIGSQGAAFMGGLAGAVEVGGLAVEQALANPITRESAKAIVGEIVTAYFSYEGATLAVDGIKQAVGAESKEEAGEAGEKLGMAAFMLAGGLKMGKKVLDKGISRVYEARVEKLQAKYREMEPQALIEELGNNPKDMDYFAISGALREKGYAVMERPIAKGKNQTVVYTPEGKAIEVKTFDGSGVSEEFVAEFDKCRSTQDLEALVKNAKTPEECDYIAKRLNNPDTKAVNRVDIEDIIDYAKFRAQGMRVDAYVRKTTPASEPAVTDAQAAVRKTGATQAKISMEKVENRYTDESLKKNFSSMMAEIESNPDIQAGNWDSHELKSDPHYDYEVYTKKVTLKDGSTATYELTIYKDDSFVNRKVYLESEVDGSEVVTSFEFFDCDTNNGWTYQTNKSSIRYNMSYNPHGKEYISPLKDTPVSSPVTNAQAAVRKTGATQTKISMEKVKNRYTDESLKKNFSSMMDEIESNPDIQAGNWDSHELKSDPHYDYEVYTKKVTLKDGSTATYELTVYKDDGFVNRKVHLENEVDGSEVVTSFEFFDCDTNNGWTYQTNKSGIRYNMSYDPHGKEYISPLKTDVIVNPQSAEVPTPIRTPQQTTVSGNFKQPQTQEIISAIEAKVAKGETLTQELINETIKEAFAKTENPDVNAMIRVIDDIQGNWSKMPEVYKNDIPTTLKDIDDIYSRAKNSHDLLGVTEKDVEALKRRIMQEPDLLVRTSAVNGQGSYNAVVQLLKDVHSMINPKIPEDITGAARLVVDKFKNRLMPKDIESIESLETWTKKQIASIYNVETHEMNPDFIADGKPEITNARQKELERWTTYLKSDESPLNSDPFGQLLLLDGITKDIGRQNTNVPPALSRGMVEYAYNRIIEDAINPLVEAATSAEPTPAPQAARNLVGQDVKSALGVDIEASVNNVNSRVVTSEPVVENGETVTYGKDANGNVIKTTTANGTIYVDGENTIVEMTPHGKHTGYTVSNGKESPVITDRNGVVIVPDENYYASIMKFGIKDAKASNAPQARIDELVDQIEVVSYRQPERPKKPDRSNYRDPRDYGEDYHDYVNWSPKTYMRYTYKGQTKLCEYDGYATPEEMKSYIAEMIYESQQ